MLKDMQTFGGCVNNVSFSFVITEKVLFYFFLSFLQKKGYFLPFLMSLQTGLFFNIFSIFSKKGYFFTFCLYGKKLFWPFLLPLCEKGFLPSFVFTEKGFLPSFVFTEKGFYLFFCPLQKRGYFYYFFCLLREKKWLFLPFLLSLHKTKAKKNAAECSSCFS